MKRALSVLILWSIVIPAYSAPLKIVASIQPISDLVAAVTQDVSTPITLVPIGASEHHYTLRPSDARNLEQADVVVWVGPPLETFLVNNLDNLSSDTSIISLIDTPGLQQLPLRSQTVWDTVSTDDHDHGHDHRHGHIDPHIWLSPENAIDMVNEIAMTLSEIDQENAETYQHNAEHAIQKITETQTAIDEELRSVQQIPYLVSHDAFQYFERIFNLNSRGAITLTPEQAPSARHIQTLRRLIQQEDIQCIFTEPQFQSLVLPTIIENMDVCVGILDPLGELHDPSLEAYLQVLNNLASSLNHHLGR